MNKSYTVKVLKLHQSLKIRTAGNMQLLNISSVLITMPYTLNAKRGNVSITLVSRCVRVTAVAVGKPVSITYSECVFVVIVTQHASTVLYCHLWHVPLYHICPHHLINSTILG
jgi:hypothetical protein